MNTKECSICGRSKALSEFRKIKGKLLPRCTVCENKRIRNWVKRTRLEMIAKYGGKCVCCGEDRHEFLAVDHVKGGGRKHREALRAQGKNFQRWFFKQEVSADFRLLCHCCNTSLGMYGYCPHQGRPEVPLVRQKNGTFIPEQQIDLDEKAENQAIANKLRAEQSAESYRKKKEKDAKRMREWRKENPEYKIQARKQSRNYQRRRHEQAIAQYGGKCRCCGERLLELLRVTPKPGYEKCPSGKMIGQWLHREGYPEGYEVLCVSCLRSVDFKGYCPHSPNLI